MSSRPHLRYQLALTVAAGGAVGTAARAGLGAGLGVVGGWPIGTLVANLVGAFALGILLEGLSRVGPETPGRRLVRLGVGTGLLGGFTTFSSLALEIERLLANGELGVAVGYAVVTIVLGVVVTVVGVLLAGRLPWGDSR